jgi:ribosome-associated protein
MTAMKKSRQPRQATNSSSPRNVAVREVPIELCQFVKFGGLTESGGEAKQLISEGRVQLNGTVETQKRKKLAAGDRVTLNGQTIVVQLT